ncbi:MAG: hypothetical protein KF862_00855 [Chitinophagaceae bacterium]|nr:hypothetical protein [Chitinophagaceae bacterium]
MTDTRKVVLDFFERLILKQDDLKSRIEDKFSTMLAYTVELVKENALSALKDDYDRIYEQLKEKSEEITSCKSILVTK